ncbi:MAG: hypothetical protein ACP5RP_03270 [Candidatus Micrarchaeia archaeon]
MISVIIAAAILAYVFMPIAPNTKSTTSLTIVTSSIPPTTPIKVNVTINTSTSANLNKSSTNVSFVNTSKKVISPGNSMSGMKFGALIFSNLTKQNTIQVSYKIKYTGISTVTGYDNFSKYYNSSIFSSAVQTSKGAVISKYITKSNGTTYMCSSLNAVAGEQNCTEIGNSSTSSALSIFENAFTFSNIASNIKINDVKQSYYNGLPCTYIEGFSQEYGGTNFTICIYNQYGIPLFLSESSQQSGSTIHFEEVNMNIT